MDYAYQYRITHINTGVLSGETDLALHIRGKKITLGSCGTFRLRRWCEALQGQVPSSTGGVGFRKSIMLHATQVFHAQWLLEDWTEGNCNAMLQTCKQSLRHLYDHFSKLLWGLDPATCPYSDAPVEMFMEVSFESLWDKYFRFNQLARRIASMTGEVVHGVYEIVALRVSIQGQERIIEVIDADMKSLKTERHQNGRIVESIQTKQWGEVVLLHRVRKPRDHLLHNALMKLQYEVLSTSQLWPVVRLYHRCFMYGIDAEAIGEHVGSVMRCIEKRHACGRPLEPEHLIRATKLRVLGIRGDLTDLGLIRRALHECFCHGKRGRSHFLVTDPRTWKTREGNLGPSLSVSRIRTQLLDRDASPFCFGWLLQDVCPYLCKPLPEKSLQPEPPPSELPEASWLAARGHIDSLRAQPLMPQERRKEKKEREQREMSAVGGVKVAYFNCVTK